jgi:hypothetical protein
VGMLLDKAFAVSGVELECGVVKVFNPVPAI